MRAASQRIHPPYVVEEARYKLLPRNNMFVDQDPQLTKLSLKSFGKKI